MPGAAKPAHPERDQHRAERRVGSQEHDRHRQQRGRDPMVAQRPYAAREVSRNGRSVAASSNAAGGARHQRDRGRGDQVAQRIGDDQPADTDDAQQDAAQRPADQSHDAVAACEQRVRTGQQRPRADDGGCASLHRGSEQDVAAALRDERDVEHPQPSGSEAEQQRGDGASAYQVGRDHQAPPVPSVGQHTSHRSHD
ncbi:MAG TPA: hypothetical protein VHJ18_15415 [Streptosporangiaceae bacterium]|nr:hypothetical protein [Streptosporangiaceae bacterium]